ncbi:hypothetical protein F6Y03_30080 [Bacillus megaterium]|nr:hypothetical protein [Priestia megaterium]
MYGSFEHHSFHQPIHERSGRGAFVKADGLFIFRQRRDNLAAHEDGDETAQA